MLQEVADRVERSGGQAYLVGGCVRDLFLERELKDYDVEVYNLKPEELEKLLTRLFGDKVKKVGKSFGVYKVGDFDFSLPRRETKTAEGHRGSDVEPDPFMSKEEAAARRDFTVNAMMMSLHDRTVHDFFGGLEDLENMVVRHVKDESFVEDPLRVFRAARFASVLEFKVADTTTELCKTLVEETKTLPKERLFGELSRVLMEAPRPSVAFRWLTSVGVTEALFKELYVLKNVEQGEFWHPEGDALEHTMLSLDALDTELRELDVMFAVLCHDMGKVNTGVWKDKELGKKSFHGHADTGAVEAEKFMRRLTDEVAMLDSVVKLVKYHMAPYDMRDALSKRVVRKMAVKVDLPKLMKVHLADKGGRGKESEEGDHWLYTSRVMQMYADVQNEVKRLVEGRHLMDWGCMPEEPKERGNRVKEVYEAQLEGEFSNLEEAEVYVKGRYR